MSPRYRFGHTSSQWRQERGAECKTSSSSWIDGILRVSMSTHFSSSPGSVSLTSLPRSESCGSHLTSVTASGIGFLSVILKIRGWKLFCSFPKTKSCRCLLPLRWLLHHSNCDCQKQVVQSGTDSQPNPKGSSSYRLLTGSNRRQHITPVLASLHWLPV